VNYDYELAEEFRKGLEEKLSCVIEDFYEKTYVNDPEEL